MSLSIFIEWFVVAALFSLAFILGGYTCFKLIHIQHEKEINFFKENIDKTDQFDDRFKKLIINLAVIKKRNTDILALYDKFFEEILIEASKETSFDNVELDAIYFEKYISERKKLTE